MLEKFDNEELLTRERDGFSAVACDVLIAQFEPGETILTKPSILRESFETLGVNEKGFPIWKDEAILREVDFETLTKGYNCSGEIKLSEINPDFMSFLEDIKEINVSLLIVPRDLEIEDKALYIENVRLSVVENGKGNDDIADTSIILKYKKRVRKLGDLYAILTETEESSLAYGLRWDSENETYTRLGTLQNYLDSDVITDPTKIPVQDLMRRCVVDADGNIVYYLESGDSRLIAGDGRNAIIDGSIGDVMVEIPEHWVKETVNNGIYEWWISQTEETGFTLIPKQYVGAYLATADDRGRIFSASGVMPTTGTIPGTVPSTSLTRSICRNYAKAKGCEVFDFLAWTTICRLFIIEYGGLNSQAKLGMGKTLYPAFDFIGCFRPNGDSNQHGNNSYEISTVGGDTGDYVSYRGIEHLWGGVWQMIDGVNVINGHLYVTRNPEDYADNTTSEYTDMGLLLSSDFYPKKPLPNTFVGAVTGGSSSTGMCDRSYASSDGMCLVGGEAAMGVDAGLMALLVVGYPDSAPAFGTRICRRESKKKEEEKK